ncbi:GNAT family N-acetyltransferase [Anaeromicropila herbilytica]|uniref:Phosphinothricin acetyltransferase n=1 Tax=Anaeromicropila herbilytica TaxID=2785025 RepID=A0A7R7ENE5_9FIRM|nr:GNAT family N-acetyltransferase [Anaeromicropila herbilytica]BCN32034.1 phosphinothricin acetyltransferase [Anaeromicropila herbilytica]
MNRTIELVNDHDIEEMLHIYAPYVLETPITFEYEVPSLNEFKERIHSNAIQFPCLVYKIDEKIVGYAYGSLFKTKAAFQWDTEVTIYLSNSHQGEGIGKSLYQTLLNLLTLQGYYNVYALITSSNEKSIHFHEYFDFHPISFYENTGFKQGKWHSLTVLHKKLCDYKENPIEPISYHLLNPNTIQSILRKYL